MKKLLLISAILLVGCTTPTTVRPIDHVTYRVVEDKERGVTCWLIDKGVSCIPSNQLKQ